MRRLLSLLSKYNYVLVFLVLEAIAFALISNHNYYQHSKVFNVSREITGWINHRFQGIDNYVGLRKRNDILIQENTRLRNQLERYRRLNDTLLHTATVSQGYHFQRARVVQRTAHRQFNYITVNKGRKDGVYRDMAAIGDQGIVGIVLESSSNYSTILPVINRDFRLSSKIKKNGYTGIVEWPGRSPEYAALNEIPYHVELMKGDTIVTSGFSAIFPEGVFIGTIDNYTLDDGNFYDITIRLGTNFLNLQYLNIVKNFHQSEQKQIENTNSEW